jgi:transcriptional regulator with XRE-family HTH domain
VKEQAVRRPVQPSEQAAMRRLLVQLRTAAGVNQTTLAARLAITQSEVSKFERGERAFDERRLRAWLHAVGVEWTPFADALDREVGRVDAIVN